MSDNICQSNEQMMEAGESDDVMIICDETEIIEIEDTDDESNDRSNNNQTFLSAPKILKDKPEILTNQRNTKFQQNKKQGDAERIPIYKGTVEEICRLFGIDFNPEWSLKQIRKMFKERTKMHKQTPELQDAIHKFKRQAYLWCRAIYVTNLPNWFQIYHVVTLMRMMTSFDVNQPTYLVKKSKMKHPEVPNAGGCEIRFLNIEDCRQVFWDLQGIRCFNNDIAIKVDFGNYYKKFKIGRSQKVLNHIKLFRRQQTIRCPNIDGGIEMQDSDEEPCQSYRYPTLDDIQNDFKKMIPPEKVPFENVIKNEETYSFYDLRNSARNTNTEDIVASDSKNETQNIGDAPNPNNETEHVVGSTLKDAIENQVAKSKNVAENIAASILPFKSKTGVENTVVSNSKNEIQNNAVANSNTKADNTVAKSKSVAENIAASVLAMKSKTGMENIVLSNSKNEIKNIGVANSNNKAENAVAKSKNLQENVASNSKSVEQIRCQTVVMDKIPNTWGKLLINNFIKSATAQAINPTIHKLCENIDQTAKYLVKLPTHDAAVKVCNELNGNIVHNKKIEVKLEPESMFLRHLDEHGKLSPGKRKLDSELATNNNQPQSKISKTGTAATVSPVVGCPPGFLQNSMNKAPNINQNRFPYKPEEGLPPMLQAALLYENPPQYNCDNSKNKPQQNQISNTRTPVPQIPPTNKIIEQPRGLKRILTDNSQQNSPNESSERVVENLKNAPIEKTNVQEKGSQVKLKKHDQKPNEEVMVTKGEVPIQTESQDTASQMSVKHDEKLENFGINKQTEYKDLVGIAKKEAKEPDKVIKTGPGHKNQQECDQLIQDIKNERVIPNGNSCGATQTTSCRVTSDILIFKNLPASVSSAALSSKLAELGELLFCELTAASRAVVRFRHPPDALRCQRIFHNSKVDGQIIEVTLI